MSELVSRQRSYTEEDRTRGLTEVALCGGNERLAAERLAEAGYDIARSTLGYWKRDLHAERYQQIRRDLMPRIHDTIASECEDRAIAQAQLEHQIEDQLRATVQHLRPNEAAGALRNLTTSKAINVDKANVLRDKPTAIVEQRPPAEILKRLALRYQAIDTTATEIQDAELVDGAQAT